MRKITYHDLQKKHPQKIVALDHAEKRIMAVGRKLSETVKVLQTKHIDPKDCVFVGPIQKHGTTNVFISLRNQTY